MKAKVVAVTMALLMVSSLTAFAGDTDIAQFKDGWGDCPLGLHLLPPGMKPCIADLDEPVIHLYLVDANLQILLAQRTVTLNEKFHQLLQKKVQEQLEQNRETKGMER